MRVQQRGAPGDAAGELGKALVEGEQLPKGGEALGDNRRQVAHVIHQLPLQGTGLSVEASSLCSRATGTANCSTGVS